MAHANRTRILVLHADPVAREGLLATFARYADIEITPADDLPDCEAGLNAALVRRVADVVVTDYDCGVELARRSTRQDWGANGIKILIVATYDREWEIRRAMEQGVRGYVVVGCGLDELALAVRAVHNGARHLSPQVIERLAESIAGDMLTTREEEVLRHVADGLGNKAIACAMGIAIGTVKSHLKGVFDKLNVISRTQAICAAERRGLLKDAAQRRANDEEAQRERVAALFRQPSLILGARDATEMHPIG